MVMTGGNDKPPPGVRRHVVARLKPGWSYDAKSGRFVSEEGLEIAPAEDLPPKSKILATVPELSEQPGEKLTPPEEELARSLQVIPPKDANLEEVLEQVRSWAWVERADPGPEIGLPGSELAVPGAPVTGGLPDPE